MIWLGLPGLEAGFDIAAIGELRKGQNKGLIPTREVFDVAIVLIAIDANLKLVGGQEICELRENRSAKIHPRPSEQAKKR